jgi:hypothetical protein
LNNRKFKRHNKRLEVKFKTGPSTVGRGFTKDISEQGVFIKCRKPMPPGSTVEITATFPDGIRGQIKGTVIRQVKGASSVSSSMNGMGIEINAYDMVFSHFLHDVVGDFIDADLSMYASSLGPPIAEEKVENMAAKPSLIPEQKKDEIVIVACTNCGARNKVPKIKFSAMPKCGKCAMFLIVSF